MKKFRNVIVKTSQVLLGFIGMFGSVLYILDAIGAKKN